MHHIDTVHHFTGAPLRRYFGLTLLEATELCPSLAAGGPGYTEVAGVITEYSFHRGDGLLLGTLRLPRGSRPSVFDLYL